MVSYNRAMQIVFDMVMRISIVCFLVMMFCGGAQVLSRYVFNMSLDWTEEVARFMFIAAALLGSALCVRTMGHISVDLVVMRLPAIGQRICAILVLVSNTMMFAVLFVYGIEISHTTMAQMAPATGISMGLVYAIVPVSGILMLLFLTEQTLDLFLRKNGVASAQKGDKQW